MPKLTHYRKQETLCSNRSIRTTSPSGRLERMNHDFPSNTVVSITGNIQWFPVSTVPPSQAWSIATYRKPTGERFTLPVVTSGVAITGEEVFTDALQGHAEHGADL